MVFWFQDRRCLDGNRSDLAATHRSNMPLCRIPPTEYDFRSEVDDATAVGSSTCEDLACMQSECPMAAVERIAIMRLDVISRGTHPKLQPRRANTKRIRPLQLSLSAMPRDYRVPSKLVTRSTWEGGRKSEHGDGVKATIGS